jgi:molybdate transport system substrate-binding protein
MNLRFLALTAAFVLAVAAGGCAAAASPDETPADTLTVFAAASLAEPFRAVADAFESDHPGVEVTFNFAGSQALRTQLEHGARADVFASADWEQMSPVRKANLLGNSPEYFATNRMAVVAPVNSKAVHSLDDLARPGVSIAIASAEAPAGGYARATLDLMAASADFPDNFAERVLANVVTNETNVRAVAQKVALGEVDAGMVYETDARAAQHGAAFRVIEIPLEFNPAAEYPIATLGQAIHHQAALDFIAFVQGDDGQAILREYGFAPPANVACPCHDGRPSGSEAPTPQ